MLTRLPLLFLLFLSYLASGQLSDEGLFWNAKFKSITDTYTPTNFSNSSTEHKYYLIWSAGLQAFFTGEKSTYNRTHELIDSIELQLKEFSNKEQAFLLGELYFVRSAVSAQEGKEFDALLDLRNCIKHVRESQSRYPDYLPILKTSGSIELLLGSVPQEYQWLLDLMGWTGSITKGETQLKRISNEETYGAEATLTRALFKSLILDQHNEALILLKSNQLRRGESSLSNLGQLLLLHKAGNAQEIINQYDQKTENHYFTNYFLGEAFLRKGAYSSSIQSYQAFLNTYHGSELKMEAIYKIGVAHLLSGNKNEAETSWNKITEMEGDLKKLDRFELINTSPNSTQLTLLQARLSMDGHFYAQSKKALLTLKKSKISSIQNIELIYRNARLSHLTEQYEQAIGGYQEVIQTQPKNSKLYFAPNSLIQLGTIYYNKGNKDLALKNFEQVFSYSGHPYKRSMDRKARSMISLIKGN